MTIKTLDFFFFFVLNLDCILLRPIKEYLGSYTITFVVHSILIVKMVRDFKSFLLIIIVKVLKLRQLKKDELSFKAF